MSASDSIDVLMQKIREGSEDAFAELIEKHGDHLFRVVRQRLDRVLRSKFDSADFVQDAWASFYRNRECLPEITNAAGLCNYLGTIARNKVIDECRNRLMSQGRNVNREVSLDEANGQPALRSSDPTGSQIAIAQEEFDRLAGTKSAMRRRIITLKAAGATYEEIGEDLGIHPKTIQRLLNRLQEATE